MLYAILAAVLVALDQLVKYLVVQNIPLGEHVPFLPYLLDLTYVENTGAAFSLFSDHTWILALISLVMSVLLAIAVWKPLFRHPFGRTALALLLAGRWATSSTGPSRAMWWTCSTCCSWSSPCSTWPTSAWWWGASPR